MSTRLFSLLKQKDQKRMIIIIIDQHTYLLRIFKYFEDRLTKYAEFSIYHQLLDYFKGGKAALKELKFSRNRRRFFKRAAKSYIISQTHESQYLQYLYIVHEDYSYHAVVSTLDYLIERIY